MKIEFTEKVKRTAEAKFLEISVPVRYDDEDIPFDFPGRTYDVLNMKIDIDSKKVVGWPVGVSADIHMKVCDSGRYELIDDQGYTMADIDEDYVPSCIGESGYYIVLKIDENGACDIDTKRIVGDFFDDEWK